MLNDLRKSHEFNDKRNLNVVSILNIISKVGKSSQRQQLLTPSFAKTQTQRSYQPGSLGTYSLTPKDQIISISVQLVSYSAMK